jgi:hypothetical protein
MGSSIFHISLIFAEVKIPVIVVFTKFDLLVVEHFRACNHILSLSERKAESIDRAERAFNRFTKGLKFPFVPVSTMKTAQKDYGGLLRSVNSLLPLKFLQLQERCS